MSENLASNCYKVYENASRAEVLPFIPESASSILDVGCSVGNFGSLLKAERSAEVWGVEMDAAAAEIAASRLDKILVGPFDKHLDIPEKRFDCIVFNDVLEHMVDPYSALIFAKELLKEGGCVVASIPNVRYFGNIWNLVVRGNWEYTDSGILDRTHLRFFTRRSIAAMFSDVGFELVETQGINAVDYYDPWLRLRFRLINFALMRAISDMRWQQFVIVARPL